MLAPELTVTLVGKALVGERQAVRALVDRLTPVIQMRVARALRRRRGAALGRDVRQEVEDLTQSVFLAIFANGGQALRKWDPARGSSLESFVGLLADHEIASILRSRRRSPWTEDPTTNEDLAEDAPPGDVGPELETLTREALRTIVDRLRERLSDRGLELFFLLFVEERATEEVCADTGLTPDAVYAWRSRIGKLVRQIAAEIVSENEASDRTLLRRPPE
ncbi:RNA polymerase sigma factor [Polyangium mundeleinium]|uniref:Sigma-70 family RNA polymerase sigma factor n=1 Tax=Polyangium mundeleinium TaxID=2995306 RepID=A0ABT5F1H7_9BACT|nr:sigma-70 family RNA polymerase sigma factor [Polyangium mundeleinium]MDC0747936.1 sigma-70 family RNA polymerase sigma factor [Polyangium mundeleinium]